MLTRYSMSMRRGSGLSGGSGGSSVTGTGAGVSPSGAARGSGSMASGVGGASATTSEGAGSGGGNDKPYYIGSKIMGKTVVGISSKAVMIQLENGKIVKLLLVRYEGFKK